MVARFLYENAISPTINPKQSEEVILGCAGLLGVYKKVPLQVVLTISPVLVVLGIVNEG